MRNDEINWNSDKNRWLKMESDRGACFEDVIDAINDGRLIEVVPHKTRPNQHMMILLIGSYIYSVPYVENEAGIFLKTIYPNRKLTRNYLKQNIS